MIYALVEPSIYMIAGILPTTRHLYRRMHRDARRRWGGQSDSDQTDNSNSFQSAELERMQGSGKGSRGTTRNTDIWQTNTNSSQDELTEWYKSKHTDVTLPSTPEARLSEGGETIRH